MEKFRYSMQNILNVQEKIEAQEKLAFQIASEAVREEENKLQALFVKKAEYEEILRDRVRAKLNVKEIKSYRDAITNTEDRIVIQRGNLRKAEQKLEVQRKRLEEAIKERKVHEVLKENAFEEYKREYEREEQKIVDELVSFQYAEKQANSGS